MSIALLTRAAATCTPQAGAVVCQIGDTIQDAGGAWVPTVFTVGPMRFQAAAVPLGRKGARAVASPVVWTCPKLAGKIAEGLARVAAA